MSFTLIRELLELERDQGLKRMLLALYEAPGGANGPSRYIALSEMVRADKDSPWQSLRKGVTIRASERESIIAALQSADFEAQSDNKHLSHSDYATQVLDEMISQSPRKSQD